VGVLIVRIVTTAFRLATVILAFQLAVATDVVVTVVDFTATTAMRSGLVGLISTASGVFTVFLVKDFLVRTTKVGARVVDFNATAALPGVVVGLISTASVVCTVLLVKDFLVRTTKMGARVVDRSAAAARVLSRQRMGHTTTTPVVSLVVNVSIAATRILVVALTYTESVVTGWHVAGL